MYSLDVSETAQREVEDAVSYIADTLGNAAAVARMIERYELALDAIATNPFAYPIDWALTNSAGFEIRHFAVGNYRIKYTADEKNRRVRILSYFHSRQDAPSRFREDWPKSN